MEVFQSWLSEPARLSISLPIDDLKLQVKSVGTALRELQIHETFIVYMHLQLWFEHHKTVTEKERELLETVLESWFVIGRMGGFNCMNLQASCRSTLLSS